MQINKRTASLLNEQLNSFLMQVEKRAFKMAMYATKNTDDALDIVQDAMMTLAQKYDDKTTDEWGALFHRIMQNKIHDYYRRNKTRNKWLTLWPFANNQATSNPQSPSYQSNTETNNANGIEDAPENKNTKPDDKLAQTRAMETLSEAVNNLPLRQQQAFLLRTWEGLSVAETALAMSCSQGSVKTHYSRAVHNLRDLLEDHI